MQPDEIALQAQFQAALNQPEWGDQVDSFTVALANGEVSITHAPSQAIQDSAYSILNSFYQGRKGHSNDDLQTLQFLLQKAPQISLIPQQYASTIQNYLDTVTNEMASAPQDSGNQAPQPTQPIQIQQSPVQQPVRALAQTSQISSRQIDLEIQQAMANPTILQKIDGVTEVLSKYFNLIPEAQTQNNFATALQTLFNQRYATNQTAQQSQTKNLNPVKKTHQKKKKKQKLTNQVKKTKKHKTKVKKQKTI